MRVNWLRTSLILILTLTSVSLLSARQVSPAHAVNQSLPTNWSAYGPYANSLLLTTFSDFNTMFTGFTSGQLDITDWPVNAADLSAFASNPDFFLTNPQAEFGIFQLDFNSHASFMGVSSLTARTTSPPGLIGSPSSASGCSIGFGRLVVNLVNLENASFPVKDSQNQLTAVGPQTFTVTDLAATGTYKVPSSTTCMLAGTYTVRTTVYAGTASVFVGSAQIVTVAFGVNYNSPSTQKLNQAGIEVRRAIAHTLDKASFIQGSILQSRADCDDLFASPPQGLAYGSCNPAGDLFPAITQSILDEDKASHPWFSGSVASAYNLVPDTIGPSAYWWASFGFSASADKGYSGQADLRAACDHFVAAGLTISPSAASCNDVANALMGTTPPSGSYPHLVPNGRIITYIRTDPKRKAFGQIMADTLNAMFGTPGSAGGTIDYGGGSLTPRYYTFSQVAPIIFDATILDDWNIYTGGFSLSSTPDHLYGILHSSFASNVCGGLAISQPSNYYFFCDPVFDSQASAGEFSTSLTAANSFFTNAAVRAFRTEANIPVFSRVQQFVALNAWSFQGSSTPQRSSLVSQLGHGWQAGTAGPVWSALNMKCNTGFNPANSAYACGGGVNGLIRRGLSQEIDQFSPFAAISVWDFEAINQVFDTMLAVNPVTAGSGSQLVDWMTTIHSSSFSPTEVSCVGTNCVTGTTTQVWHLRNDLKFHDGVQVTADDVVYTILAYRDVPSANLQPNVATVSSAVSLNPTTVQVKLQLQSPFYELNIGSLPIIPKHVWAPICGSPPSPASQCANPFFDPVGTGIFIGSGPWLCKNLNTGAVGGSCTQNADGSIGGQHVSVGGRVLLTVNPNYMRGPANLQGSSLHKLSWADKNDDGVVNILDIGDAALHFGSYDPYWDNPLFGTTPGVVDIGELSTIAFYFDHGTTTPFRPSQLTALDPQVDPFRADLTSQGGPVVFYEGGPLSGSQLTAKLVSLSGATNPSLFTGTLSTASGAPIGTATGVGGPGNTVLMSFSGVSSGQFVLAITWNLQPAFTITLNL